MRLLHKEFDKLQLEFGAKELNSIYGGGCETEPELCFVFMNPTRTNIASVKDWNGIRYPFLGTKNVWKLLSEIGAISNELNVQIQSMKASEWTTEFCSKVYDEITKNKVYITNLAKCTQLDARHLNDEVYKKYLGLFKQEMSVIKPKTIVLFGNQVSSIILGENIKVSQERKNQRLWNNTRTFAVFYPIGNGRFNLPKAVEDLKYIKELL